MTRIDRYLLFLYLRVFVICFFSLSGLLVIVHLFTNLDEFIEYSEVSGGLPLVLSRYYGPYVLSLFNQLSGLLALMAMMFVIAWLYRTNELTSMLAAGISKGRIVRPLLLASLGIFALATISREVVIPRFADSLDKSPQDLVGQGVRKLRPSYDLDFGVLIGGRHLIPSQDRIVDPIFRLEGPGAALGQQFTAEFADYVDADASHPRGYILRGVRSPKDLGKQASIVDEAHAYVLTAAEHSWLAANECFVASNLQFSMLNGKSNWTSYASVGSIIAKIRSDPRYYGDDVRVILHAKIMQPLADFTLVLFGLPIVLSRPDRHLFWVAGVSMAIIGGFSALLLAFQILGNSEGVFQPSAAVWIPLLICSPIAWVNARKAMAS